MDRFVMRHPETGVALIPQSSLHLHKARGWLRVSDAIDETAMHQVDLRAYAEAVDLDAAPAEMISGTTVPEITDEPGAAPASESPASPAKPSREKKP